MREKGQGLSAKTLPDKNDMLLARRVWRSRTELAGERWFEQYKIKHEYIQPEDCQVSISILDIIPGIVNLARRSHHLTQ